METFEAHTKDVEEAFSYRFSEGVVFKINRQCGYLMRNKHSYGKNRLTEELKIISADWKVFEKDMSRHEPDFAKFLEAVKNKQ